MAYAGGVAQGREGSTAVRRKAAAPVLAARTSALRPNQLLEILHLARGSGAADLATGTPSFPEVEADLIAEVYAAVNDGRNQYEDSRGNAALRTAVARAHGADPDTEITITAGATEGLTAALLTLVEPGDEVVVLEPYFEPYPAAIRLAGATPRFVRLHAPDWRWDVRELRRAFGPRTKAVIVNSPHNPTGRVLGVEELAELVGLCEHWNSTLISDEVYAEFVDEPAAVVLPSDLDAGVPVIGLRSTSKSHAVSGWRIGWVFAPPELTRALRAVHEVLVVGCAAPLQAAAAAVLDRRPGWSAAQRAELAGKRLQTLEAVREAGFTVQAPEGACYLLARIPDRWPDAAPAARRLVTAGRVATAPGDFFYDEPSAGSRHLRLAYNKSAAVLDTALERLTAAAARMPTG